MGSAAQRLAASLAREVRDERVLAAIAAVPRERFVPRGERALAYEDRALPIGRGQTISQPYVVARMCELAAPAPGDRVLDVGTGSGWHAAVLAELVRPGGAVWSVERHGALAATARAALADAGVGGVVCVVGDGSAGLPEHAPYDVVNVAAATPEDRLAALEAQLAPGGRLVAPVGLPDAQRLMRGRRPRDGGAVVRECFEGVRFVPLVSEPGPARSG